MTIVNQKYFTDYTYAMLQYEGRTFKNKKTGP
ncbi:hypothetical protein DES35_10166 [Schleiferia thermophila]|uniref:Uncharacterized protein n=1 Tax=Schleiferia thermophila TaxID=884107 RepID=A0A369A908_9FLAO|nr:hypothetical protein DES35_10166 [Schleiferia thermophila]